jgi:hypothetical protein
MPLGLGGSYGFGMRPEVCGTDKGVGLASPAYAAASRYRCTKRGSKCPCVMIRSSGWRCRVAIEGSRQPWYDLRGRARSRVAVAGDAAGGAARELCVVEFVGAERLPAVAVPSRGLCLHPSLWLDVRVEHDRNGLFIKRGLWWRPSRGSSARRFEARRADHRVGAIADRQLGRMNTVCRQPRLDRAYDLDYRPCLPF